MAVNFGIAIHGGAGTILKSTMTPELQAQYEDALKCAVETGFRALENGGSALDAVEAAVTVLEDFPLFNAGKGSVFNNKGSHEMDAAIMSGSDLNAGTVCGIKSVANPIQVARKVMEESGHVMLMGDGALEFAKSQGFEVKNEDYFFTQQRYNQWQEAMAENKVQLDHTEKSDKKFGTVGAVALDKNGNLAAATSTGGLTNKKFGRIGDSPVVGAGTYANNDTCAISCTGVGELFIRKVVGHNISCRMAFLGETLQKACDVLVHDELVKIGGEGGLVAIDKNGNIYMPFNSEGMYRASMSSSGTQEILIYK